MTKRSKQKITNAVDIFVNNDANYLEMVMKQYNYDAKKSETNPEGTDHGILQAQGCDTQVCHVYYF